MTTLFFRALCAAVMLFAAATQAVAVSTIINTRGFYDYDEDVLTGQPTGGGPGSWRETLGNGIGGFNSTAVVQSDVYHPFPSSGLYANTKAVRVDRAAQDDTNWAIPVSDYPLVGSDLIVIEWDMLVEQSDSLAPFGPFFGVQAYDNSSPLALVGSVGVDATTGEVLYQADGDLPGQIQVAMTGGSPVYAAFDTWNQFRLALDYTNQAYQVTLNNELVVSAPFVDGDATGFTDADIAAIASAGDSASQDATGTSYFDNFVVVNFDRVPGDYNTDGQVDNADYDLWKGSYGSTPVAGTGADGNGNGMVDAGDYTIWRDNLNAVASSLSVGGSPAPEPTAAWLAVSGLLAYGVRKRR